MSDHAPRGMTIQRLQFRALTEPGLQASAFLMLLYSGVASNPASWRLLGALLTVLYACQPVRHRLPEPIASPAPVLSADSLSISASSPVLQPPTWQATTYQVALMVVSSDAVMKDSTQDTLLVQFLPELLSASDIQLSVISKLDTIRASTDTLRRFVLRTDGALLRSVTNECSSSKLSALLVRLLSPRYAISWPQQESLRYTTCNQGTLSSVNLSFTWQAPRYLASSHVWEQTMVIAGTLVADSTRTLPVRLQGSLLGHATIQLEPETVQPLSGMSFVELRLIATSTLREQVVTQTTTLRFNRVQ